MPIESALVIVVVLFVIAILPIWNYWHVRDGLWHSHQRGMRRLTKTGWEHRPMTESESDADQSGSV
jgi:hypothetical protein